MGLFSVSSSKKKKNRFINPDAGMPNEQRPTETFVYSRNQKPINNNGMNNVNAMPANNLNMNNMGPAIPNNVEQRQPSNGVVNSAIPSNMIANPLGETPPSNNVVNNNVENEIESLEELPRQLGEVPKEEKKEEKLDPLNNADNPIPVNPVAPVEEKKEEEVEVVNAKASFFSVIGMTLGMILRPGTTMINNSKKYSKVSKAMFILLWTTILTLIITIAARFVVGSFSRTYNAIIGTYSISLTFENVLDVNNYLEYILIGLLVSFIAILVISTVFYGSSFINSKGVKFGSYLIISNTAMIPFIIGVTALGPLLSILSTYFAVAAYVFTFLYSMICLMIGMDEVLVFKSVNKRIFYYVLNLTVIVIILIAVVYGLIQSGFIGGINI